jgi:integrase
MYQKVGCCLQAFAAPQGWIPDSKHKNGGPHSVPLNEMALSVLRNQIGKHPTRVFTFKGEPVANVYTKAFKAALERAGIEDFVARPAAPWHRQAWTPTHELQRLGGWKTGAMVERYAHLAQKHCRGQRIGSMRSAATKRLRRMNKGSALDELTP